ncbi:MAG: hypothetical protein PHC30_06835 [Lentisphaeria bacterium]|nr:hypothetical protein [Lentisphaeria bacterium]
MTRREINLTGQLTEGPQADNADVLQNALEGGHCRIVLPPGRFPVSRTLKVSSGTRLEATEQTVIRRADGTARGAEDWLLTNADMEHGNEDIELLGGVWDANNAANPRGADCHDLASYGGTALNFIRVDGLRLRHLTVANADAFYIRLCRVEDFDLRAIRLFSTLPKINQDGVHLNGHCRRGVISDLRAMAPMSPGDDMVALNADDGWDRHLNYRMDPGPIEDIAISDLTAESAYTFIRLLSQTQPIRRIRIAGLHGGVRCNLLNVGKWRFPPGLGDIADISISDVDAHKMPAAVGDPAINPLPLCLFELNVDRFTISRFRRHVLDNSRGETFRMDWGRPHHVVLERDDTTQGFTATPDGCHCSLAAGGFERLEIRRA